MIYLFVYVTCRTKKEAQRIATILLQKKSIACASIFPIRSIYLWDEKITTENEVVLILKTTENKFEMIKKEIIQIHSYQIPCITKIKVESNEEYATWMQKQLS